MLREEEVNNPESIIPWCRKMGGIFSDMFDHFKFQLQNGCFQKLGGKPFKMDGLEWKTPIKMDDLGGKPTILENPQIDFHVSVGSDMFFCKSEPSEGLVFRMIHDIKDSLLIRG